MEFVERVESVEVPRNRPDYKLVENVGSMELAERTFHAFHEFHVFD